MKKIAFTAIVWLVCTAIHAQQPFPRPKPGSNPPKIPNGNTLPATNPEIIKGAEEKKQIDKILNAHVTKIRLIVSSYNVTPTTFVSRQFTVKSTRSDGFSYSYDFGKSEPTSYDTPKSIFWQFDRKDKMVTYKDLMNEGFTVFLSLRHPRRTAVPLEATFAVEFIFNNGNSVIVSMGDKIMIPGQPQMHFKNVYIAEFSRTFKGPTDVLPNPEDPLVPPTPPR